MVATHPRLCMGHQLAIVPLLWPVVAYLGSQWGAWVGAQGTTVDAVQGKHLMAVRFQLGCGLRCYYTICLLYFSRHFDITNTHRRQTYTSTFPC